MGLFDFRQLKKSSPDNDHRNPEFFNKHQFDTEKTFQNKLVVRSGCGKQSIKNDQHISACSPYGYVGSEAEHDHFDPLHRRC